MEKRTILAFVLSFAVLLVWSYIYTPKQPSPVPEEQELYEQKEGPSQDQTQQSPQTTAPPISVTGIEKPLQTISSEKAIIVETPLYRAVFSNREAAIKSFKLKKYLQTKDPGSPFIELVNLKDNDAHFKVDFVNPDEDGGAKIYSVSNESLMLNQDSAPKELSFMHTDSNGVTVVQTFRFNPNGYNIGLRISILNNSQNIINGSLSAHIRNLPPEKNTGNYSFVGIAVLLDKDLEQIKPKKLKKEEKNISGPITWMAYEDAYFMSSFVPGKKDKGFFRGRLLDFDVIEAIYSTSQISINPAGKTSSEFSLYMGPKDLDILRQSEKDLDKAVDFGFVDIIAKPLHYVLLFLNRYVHNYGVSIIILTILIKIIFWPLTHKSYKSMKEMQKLQPLMAKIREKYKNNREQMQRELMGLYKTYKINPMSGCLPMIIQLPVFFALFRILGSSIELRHAPFFLWIDDLAAPDRLFSFPFEIPLMAPPYGIPVLTLLMGASMFLQQKMTPTPGDPAQAKMMMLLPIIFTFMFINFPSGLVLYWLTNNILSIGQQYRIKRSRD